MSAGGVIGRWAWILASLAVIGLTSWLTYEQMLRGPARIRAENDAGATSGAAAAGSASAGSGTGAGASSGSASAADAGIVVETTDAGGGLSLFGLLDASAMPSGAPRSVRLGVVLVQWAGAEGAPSSARSKVDALKHAQELVEHARQDFKATVKEGDSGSSEDIGRIPRGVLEQRTEVAVFSMAAGDISEPLETPRGYWIVKRIE